jgi:hypothetical protein
MYGIVKGRVLDGNLYASTLVHHYNALWEFAKPIIRNHHAAYAIVVGDAVVVALAERL